MVDAGGEQIGVVQLQNGELRAVRNWCPHKGAPICRGIVGGTWPPSGPGELAYGREGEVLVCPWHGFEYDLKTGKEMFETGVTRLRMYPVSVQDGQVYVTI
jgi:nitrite reductase/ring-hydroxylating ferredoxin subunit